MWPGLRTLGRRRAQRILLITTCGAAPTSIRIKPCATFWNATAYCPSSARTKLKALGAFVFPSSSCVLSVQVEPYRCGQVVVDDAQVAHVSQGPQDGVPERHDALSRHQTTWTCTITRRSWSS